MGTFRTDITIDAPPEDVWAVLADIGAISRWNPGVFESHLSSASPEGVGAARHCDLGGQNYLDEEVVTWEPEKRLTMRINETNLPFETADIRFELRPSGAGTEVILSPEYRLKFGPIGAFLDWIYVRRTYRQGMHALLRGLKDDVEQARG